MKKYKTGFIRNDKDNRDNLYLYNKRIQMQAAILGGDSKRPIDYVPFIADQKNTSSCVAHAVVMAIMIAMVRTGAYKGPLSFLYNYFYARLIDGWENKDNGARIRSACKAFNKKGNAKDSRWKFNTKKVNKRPSFVASVSGFSLKDLLEYYWIPRVGREKAIKHAIDNGRAVVFGADISNDIFRYKKGSKPLMPPSKDDIVGGHAMVINDYIEYKAYTEYCIQNSWGDDYGIDGHLFMHEDYIKSNRVDDLAVFFLKGESI